MLWMGFVLIDYSVSVDEFHLFIDICRQHKEQHKNSANPLFHAFLLCISWVLWFRIKLDFGNVLRHFLFIIHSPTNIRLQSLSWNDWRNSRRNKTPISNERNGLQSNALRLLNVNVNQILIPECKHPDSREYYVTKNCWNAHNFPLHF